MQNIMRVGLDLTKSVFVVFGVDERALSIAANATTWRSYCSSLPIWSHASSVWNQAPALTLKRRDSHERVSGIPRAVHLG